MPLADPIIIQSADRLDALRNLCLLDTPADPAFDRLASLVIRILHVPVALVVLVDANRQFFKSQIGLPEPYATLRKTPLSHSFCQHVVATGGPLIIENALIHNLVHDNLAIRDLNVIAYAGIPLKLKDGQVIGSFCAIDSKPHVWTDHEIGILTDLATSVMTEIELLTELRERERLEERRRQNEHFLHQILITAPDLIYVFDSVQKRNVFANEELSAYLGYSPGEVLAMGSGVMSILLHPDDLQRRLAILNADKYLDDDTIIDDDFRILHRDGSYRWLNSRTKAFKHAEDGSVCQIIGVARDITAWKEAERHTLELAIQKDKFEVYSSFIRKTSHDFRTPLSIMNSSLYLLARDDDAERRKQRIPTIQEQVDYLSNLVNQLQSFVDLTEAGDLEVHLTNINDNVNEISKSVAAEAQGKGLKFEIFPASDLPLVQIDTIQLNGALCRIIENAIAYTPSGGKISLNTHSDNHNVMIEICDNGIGIPEADLPHIFDLFYKADKSRTHGIGTKGAGIGLAIAKHVIDVHHGHIEVESTLGEGSLFRVCLPILSSS